LVQIVSVIETGMPIVRLGSFVPRLNLYKDRG
jgi:hypothetical protein